MKESVDVVSTSGCNAANARGVAFVTSHPVRDVSPAVQSSKELFCWTKNLLVGRARLRVRTVRLVYVHVLLGLQCPLLVGVGAPAVRCYRNGPSLMLQHLNVSAGAV